MKNFKKMLCVLLAVVTVLSSLLTVPTLAATKSLKTPQITKLTSTYDSITFFSTPVKGATGYHIQICPNKKFKIGVEWYVENNDTVIDLESNKKFYIRIRAYKKSGKKINYSKWSSVKSIKTKKKYTITVDDHTYTPATDDNYITIAGSIEEIEKEHAKYHEELQYTDEYYWFDNYDEANQFFENENNVDMMGRCNFCRKWIVTKRA